jgi:hypothetical protein
MDTYSKVIQTIIAIALVWLSIHPMLFGSSVEAQGITNVRVVGFDLNAPLPVVSGGSAFPVNIVGAAAPVAVSISGPLPLPVVSGGGSFPVDIVGAAAPVAVSISAPLPLPIITRWTP